MALSSNNRIRLIAVGIAALVAGAIVGAYALQSAGIPEPQITTTPAGYATFMSYCESDANTSPDRQKQVEFLRSHALLMNGDTGNVWLDHMVNNGDKPIYIRYYAGKNDGSHRCMFGLVQTANHPERDAATLRYERNGKPFVPREHQFCVSAVPPVLSRNDSGRQVATLRCDKVL